tara:strand:+ start:1375 stop:2454 length:1080 start_codon:yes stop_codon:yes gene_type:complete
MYSKITLNTRFWRITSILCFCILWDDYGSISLHAQTQLSTDNQIPAQLQLNKSPRIYSEVDSIHISTPFNIVLVTPTDIEDEIIFPDSSSLPPTLFLSQASYGSSTTEDSVQYTFQYFGNQDLKLSGLRILYKVNEDTISIPVPTILLPFSSRLEPIISRGDSLTLNPVKPNFSFFNPWFYALLIGIIAACLAQIWWYNRSRKKLTQPDTSIELPVYESPLQILERKLQQIQQDNYPLTDDAIKIYYSRISDAFRSYYEVLYGFPALESTSRELLGFLNKIVESSSIVDKIGSLLISADQVKFAKFKPTEEQIQFILEESFVCFNLLEERHQRRLQAHKKEFEQLHDFPENTQSGDSLT